MRARAAAEAMERLRAPLWSPDDEHRPVSETVPVQENELVTLRYHLTELADRVSELEARQGDDPLDVLARLNDIDARLQNMDTRQQTLASNLGGGMRILTMHRNRMNELESRLDVYEDDEAVAVSHLIDAARHTIEVVGGLLRADGTTDERAREALRLLENAVLLVDGPEEQGGTNAVENRPAG